MLCPECGKEVGPQAVLCADCKLAKEPKVEAEEASAEAASNVPSLNQKPKYQKPTRPPEIDQELAAQNSAKPYIIAISIIAIVILGIYFGTRESNPSGSGTSLDNQPVPSPSPAEDGTQPAASPVASPSLAPAEEISFGNDKWKDSVAIWDPKESELFVGLYSEPISENDRFGIKSTGLLPKKPNSFSFTFLLEEGASTLSQATIRGVKTVYRPAVPSEEPLNFSYVIKKELPVASALSGNLGRESVVQGNSKQTGEKTLDGGKRVRLTWDIAFKAPIIHVTEGGIAPTSNSGTEPKKTPERSAPTPPPQTTASNSSNASQTQDVIRDGEYGSISADDLEMSVKEAFALLYPETGSVAIGFYGQELTDADRDEIRAKKVVTSIVNGKRPAMVLTLDFGKKNGEISRSGLSGYSAYFYRDSSGLFVFRGAFDSKSVRKSSKDFQDTEFTVLNGKLEEGSVLQLRTAGDNAPEEGYTKFSWKLAAKVKLFAAK